MLHHPMVRTRSGGSVDPLHGWRGLLSSKSSADSPEPDRHLPGLTFKEKVAAVEGEKSAQRGSGFVCKRVSVTVPSRKPESNVKRMTPDSECEWGSTVASFHPVSDYEYPENCKVGERVTLVEMNSNTPPVRVEWPSGWSYWVHICGW